MNKRFHDCGIRIHPKKTKVIYCKDKLRNGNFSKVSFTFLGYEFKARPTRNLKTGLVFMGFNPAIPRTTLKQMRKIIKFKWKIGISSNLSLEELAVRFNPIIRGWINYYGKFFKSSLHSLARYLNETLCKWARRKYLKLRRRRSETYRWLKRVFNDQPRLFAHWEHFKVY